MPQRSEERYRQIAMRGYIALALIDNAEWFSWQEHGADGTSNKADSTASDSLYPIVYPGYPDTARESAEGLQAYINMLQQWMKDGVVPYAYGSGERDVWAWNADRLDEYRWKWGLSEAALYDDVMRLGMQTRASMAGYDCRSQITTEEDSTGVDVFLYPMRGDATAEEIDGELATWMRGALHMMLALNDKAQWARFSTVDADNGAHCWGRAFADASAYDIAGARESREGLEKLIKALKDDIERGQVGESFAMMEDGAEVPSAAPASPLGTNGESIKWPVTQYNDPHSVKAEDYKIVYDAEKLPDWDTCALSYLCAYYLNADGAYAEGAMDVLAQRYSQLPQQVRRYIWTLSGQADPRGNGDAAEALLADISWYITSQLTGGMPVTVSYEKDQLSIAVTEVYSVVYRTVKYDENYSEDIPVYKVGSGAQLSVIKGEGFTLYGRYNEENVALHNGDVVELTEQFVGLGMDGQYAVRFQYRSAAETAEKTTLSFNDTGAGMVSYPAYVFRGSGYAITVLGNAWHQMTLSSGWTDICVDGSPAINGKPAEVWQSTEDINTQLAVVHLGAMTLKEAQEWSKGAAGDGFTLTESKQGDMSGDGKNGSTEMYWTCGFYGTGSDRLAVIKTYPVAQTEHLGYALNAMADTFTLT